MAEHIGADPAILLWIVQEVGRSLDEASDALDRASSAIPRMLPRSARLARHWRRCAARSS